MIVKEYIRWDIFIDKVYKVHLNIQFEKMERPDEIDIDKIINKLLDRSGKDIKLLESEIRAICLKAREIFLSQPMLLELEAPIKICGNMLWLFRRHSWSVCRPYQALLIRRLPRWPELFIFGRLHRSRKTIDWMYLTAVCL